MLLAAGLLLALLGWAGWRGWNRPAPAPAPGTPARVVEPGQQALDALRKLRFVQRTEIVRRDGRTTVRGYVENATQKREAEAVVKRLNVSVMPTIHSEEEMLRAGREVLGAFGLASLNLRAAGPGVVEAQGRAESAAAWERARTSLRQDVPGLMELRDTEVLAGPAPPARPGVPSPAPAAATAAPAAPGPAGGPLRIVGVATGRLGYVTLHNGRKYFAGAVLPGGATLAEIETGGATLEIRGQRVRVAVGEELPAFRGVQRDVTDDVSEVATSGRRKGYLITHDGNSRSISSIGMRSPRSISARPWRTAATNSIS